LFVWVFTPFMRPFLWKRLLFTYPLPCVPMICLWDGFVSQLRAYTPDELRALGGTGGRPDALAGWLHAAHRRTRSADVLDRLAVATRRG
jgi:hypothetical protein